MLNIYFLGERLIIEGETLDSTGRIGRFIARQEPSGIMSYRDSDPDYEDAVYMISGAAARGAIRRDIYTSAE